MKQTFLLLFIALLCASPSKSQSGADNIYFNSLAAGFDYQATTFVIDSARPTYQFPRGLLLWAANSNNNTPTRQSLSLDEIDSTGTPVTEHNNIHANVGLRSLQPKTIIRSVFSKSYYLLAYVVSSPNPINGLTVNSSPIVFKIDDNLNLIWSAKIHFSSVSDANSGSLIEYNELMELDDKNLALVGRYSEPNKQHALQITKLAGSNGSIIWSNWYYMWDCNSNGLAIEEATNNELVVTGYVEKCNDHLFSGFRQLLFGRVDKDGNPIQFRRFFLNSGEDVSGDKISRFQSFGPTVRDRYFITGFLRFRDPVLGGAINQQSLVIDISQLGDINRAEQFGDAGVDEVSDHIFTQTNDPNNTVFELNLTGSTTSYGPLQAYIATVLYDVGAQDFSLFRYDVIKNVYGHTIYGARWGHEIKYAGPQRFAVLLNSRLVTTPPTYNHVVSHVFIRSYVPTTPPQDTTCFSPRTPPMEKLEFNLEDKDPSVEKSPYRIYPESWTSPSPISKKLDCGPLWRISPRLALRNILRRGLYRGPGDVVPMLRIANPVSVQQLPQSGSGMLYPNPAADEVSVLLDKTMLKRGTPITIALYSPDMKLIRSTYANGKPLQRISLEGTLPGIYLLQVRQEGCQRTYRFIKK